MAISRAGRDLWRGAHVTALAGLAIGGAAAAPAPAHAAAPIACFKEGVPAPEVGGALADPAAAQAFGPQPAFASSRWYETAAGTTGVQGDAVVMTWGIVPDGTGIGAAFPNSPVFEASGPSDLIATFDVWYGRETWLSLVRQSFDRWSALTGIQFVEEPNDDGLAVPSLDPAAPGVLGVRPDIRIGGHAIDGALAIVAYAYPPDDGDIVLDTSDALFFQSTSSGYRRLRNTLMHEIGHAMGLEHVCPLTASKLMEPNIVLDFDGPQHDDLIAMQSFYGDAREDDDFAAEAFDLGIVAGQLTARLDLSVDGAGDEDWIAVPDQTGLAVTVSLQPYGETYSIADSNAQGACSGVTPVAVDTLSNQDLALEVLGSDGTTVLASADANAAGGGEALTDVPVPGGGFVRVVGDGAGSVQIYDLTVEYVPEPGRGLSVFAGLATVGLLRRVRGRRGGATP